MRVRLVTDYLQHRSNEIIEVTKEVAKQLVSKGLAIYDKSMTDRDYKKKGVKRG